jgi:hypothetical protein
MTIGLLKYYFQPCKLLKIKTISVNKTEELTGSGSITKVGWISFPTPESGLHRRFIESFSIPNRTRISDQTRISVSDWTRISRLQPVAAQCRGSSRRFVTIWTKIIFQNKVFLNRIWQFKLWIAKFVYLCYFQLTSTNLTWHCLA